MVKYIIISSLMFIYSLNISSQDKKDTLLVHIHKNDTKEIPDSTNFVEPYPNPFSPTTTLGINVKEKSVINIGLYDQDWNYLFFVVENEFEPGRYNIDYDASPLKSGIYYFKLTSGKILDTKKTILVK